MCIVNYEDMVEGNLYVTIKTIDIKNSFIIPSGTMLQLEYVCRAFDDMTFWYINGKVVEQDLKRVDIKGTFRLPYKNELKIRKKSRLI